MSVAGISPINLDELLENLAYDRLSCEKNQDWYRAPNGEPRVPFLLSPSQLDESKSRLRRGMQKNSVHLADVKAAVVFEDRFNRLVGLKRSKAGCAWDFVSGHLHHIWINHGGHHPLVVVDRQGGRRTYKELLESTFPPAEVSTLSESPHQSGYRICQGDREMHVIVQVESERRHFPVALASMTAKYVRELLMRRFQDFWSAHAPGVRPTFGYFGDGRRFLEEIRPLVAELKIDPENFIRFC